MKEICDLRINHYKFADLRTFTPHKFSDLRLRNEPKSFRGLYNVQCTVSSTEESRDHDGVCRTCLREALWCDGIQHCPDDEKGCPSLSGF
jgi:hypothetical protein